MTKQVPTVVFMRQLNPLAQTFVAGLALLANLGMASAPRPMAPNGSTTVSDVVLGALEEEAILVAVVPVFHATGTSK